MQKNFQSLWDKNQMKIVRKCVYEKNARVSDLFHNRNSKMVRLCRKFPDQSPSIWWVHKRHPDNKVPCSSSCMGNLPQASVPTTEPGNELHRSSFSSSMTPFQGEIFYPQELTRPFLLNETTKNKATHWSFGEMYTDCKE